MFCRHHSDQHIQDLVEHEHSARFGTISTLSDFFTIAKDDQLEAWHNQKQLIASSRACKGIYVKGFSITNIPIPLA